MKITWILLVQVVLACPIFAGEIPDSLRISQSDSLAMRGQDSLAVGNAGAALTYWEQGYNLIENIPGQEARIAAYLNAFGVAHEHLGHYDKAVQAYQTAATYAIEQGVFSTAGLAYKNLGLLYHRIWNDSEKALAYTRQAEEMYQKAGDVRAQLQAKNDRVTFYWAAEDYESALQLTRELIEGWATLPDSLELAYNLHNAGLLLNNLGRYEESEAYFIQAVPLYTRFEEYSNLMEVIRWIAIMRRNQHKFEDAITTSQAYIEMARILDPNALLDAYETLASTYYQMGECEAAIATYDTLYHLAQTADDLERQRNALYYTGVCLKNNGAYDQARAKFEAAATFDQQLENTAQLSLDYNMMGICYDQLDQQELAIPAFLQSAQLDSINGNPKDVGINYRNVALMYHELADYTTAQMYYEQAIQWHQTTQDSSELIDDFDQAGDNFQKLKQFDLALSAYHQQRMLAEARADTHQIAKAYQSLGETYRHLKQPRQGIAYYEKALALDPSGIYLDLGYTFNGLALCYDDLDDYPRALTYFLQAAQADSLNGDESDFALNLQNVALTYTDMGQYDNAAAYYQRALAIHQNLNDFSEMGDDQQGIGDMFYNTGQYDDALQAYQQALAYYQQAKNQAGIAQTFDRIGDAFSSTGHVDSAQAYYEQANTIFVARNDASGQASVAVSLGLMETERGNTTAALDQFQRGLELYQMLQDSSNIAIVYENLGVTLNRMGRNEEAFTYYQQAIEIMQKLGENANLAHVYQNLATTYSTLGHYPQARDYYEIALAIYRRINDRKNESALIANLAYVYLSTSNYRRAEERFMEALEISHEIGDRPGQAIIFEGLSDTYLRLGNYPLALEYANLSLEIYQDIGDRWGEGGAYLTLGNAYFGKDEYQTAIKFYQKSLEIGQETQNMNLRGTQYNNLGVMYFHLGDYDQSMEHLNRAEALYHSTGDRYGLALTLANWSEMYTEKGDYARALESATRALNMYREMEVTGRSAWMMHDLGKLHRELGNYDRAFALLDSALAIYRSIGQKTDTGNVLAEIGFTHQERAEFDAALDYYQQALQIAEAVGRRKEKGKFLMLIGSIHTARGEYTQALERYDTVYQLFNEIEYRVGVRDVAEKRGKVHFYLGDYERALQQYRIAYHIDTELGRKVAQAKLTLKIGQVELAQGKFNAAKTTLSQIETLEVNTPRLKAAAAHRLAQAKLALGEIETLDQQLQQALEWYRTSEDRLGMAEVYLTQGDYLLRRQQYPAATEAYTAAHHLALEIGVPELVWQAQWGIGRALAGLNQIDSAVTHLQAAVQTVESLREQLASENIQQSYNTNKMQIYEELIQLLFDLNREKEALEYLERSRSQLLRDSFRGLNYGTNEESSETLNRLKELDAQNARLTEQITAEKAKPFAKQNQKKIEELSRLVASNEAEFNELIFILEADPDYKNLIAIRPDQFSDLQSKIPPGSLFLEYFPSQTELYIFAITPDQLTASSVEIPRDELNQLVTRFRRQMDREAILLRDGMPTHVSSWQAETEVAPLKALITQLYAILIRPIAAAIEPVETLTVIPTGSLYYLPFAALGTEDENGNLQFLIETKRITTLTAATLQDLIAEKKPETGENCLLAFGNPDGTLAGALKEVIEIKEVFPEEAYIYTLSDATESRAKTEAGNCGVLHFATHGNLDPNSPMQSFLTMASDNSEDDGKLTLVEILRLPLKKQTHLVTLSACNTAMGENPSGLELISLARAFAMAGTPSLIASLWSVSDDATQELMKTFYANWGKIDKAEALRQAQLTLMAQPEFRHPFYWSPFVLIGDYR